MVVEGEKKKKKNSLNVALFLLKSSLLQVQGFVFNAPYKSANAAADLVKSTGAHTSSQPDVEYIMSVHLHPYSNHVIVAWIMVGVMGAE